MKIILLKDVKGVGRRFEEKEVSSGYATNYLLPKGLAVPATGAKAGEIKNLKEKEVKSKEVEREKLSSEVQKIANAKLTVRAKVNEKGHLFAALTRERVSEILSERGIQIPSSVIVLDDGIKEAGEHSIPIKIGEKETHLTLSVEAE